MSHPITDERKRALNLALKRNLARRKAANNEAPQQPLPQDEQEAQQRA